MLYDGHSIEEFIEKGYYIVGQQPSDISKYMESIIYLILI